MKPVEFCGSALADLKRFPEKARREAGRQLRRVQHGLDPHDWKPVTALPNTGIRTVKTQQFDSVWDALEDTPEAAQNMTLRSDLMIALEEYIKRNKMSQARAAQLFGVTQPRVSDLVRGKIELFSLDSLINMAVAAGMKIELRITQGPPRGGDTNKETAAR